MAAMTEYIPSLCFPRPSFAVTHTGPLGVCTMYDVVPRLWRFLASRSRFPALFDMAFSGLAHMPTQRGARTIHATNRTAGKSPYITRHTPTSHFSTPVCSSDWYAPLDTRLSLANKESVAPFKILSPSTRAFLFQ